MLRPLLAGSPRHPLTKSLTRATRRRLLLALALLAAWPALELPAQSGGPYRLRKQAVLPGGQASASAGAVAVAATVGEGVAGVQQGGSYRVTAGFQTPRRPDALFAADFE